MRPAGDVARHVFAARYSTLTPAEVAAAAVIEADRKQVREAAFREACEMIEREFDAPHVIDVSRRITSAIEREFLGGKA